MGCATFFFCAGDVVGKCAGKETFVMCEDKERKKWALESIQSFIVKGDSFALNATAVPFGKLREIAQWNKEVVEWFIKQLYCGNEKRCKELEDELRVFVAVGDRYFILRERLQKCSQEIESGSWTFRKFSSNQERLLWIC